MSFSSARAVRAFQSSLRHTGVRATPRIAASARTQLAVGRRYASGGSHGHGEASSDLPWLLGACVVTPPCVYYLLPSESHAEHHGGHEEHAEAHEEKEEEKEAPQEEEAPAEEPQPEPEPEPEQAPQQEEKKDEPQATDTTEEQEKAKESEETAKPSGTEGDSQPMSNDANKISSKTEEGTAEQKDQPESRGNKENVSFKGKMKEDAEGQSDNRKREPDSKGAYKKRVDSGLGKDLGASDNPAIDAASTSKQAAKGSGDVSGKQYGLSTTATRHSHQIDQDPSKSKKPEGPETAKSMGTIDPNRPQV
ncbi:hypothetical protein D0869_10625 [Hortaea werneckii]|uniref:Uncharacterized protein n=1 Tax=Hortaea werneckii TaxID=91943 RepID=A0A3M7B039_HORWE|nr:hypothetical protein D0869_10625 [Hortaea werneckii]RMY08528.1 hypothetical protein D0868_04753 [Hortaea werneckii]RMY20109.1 hypothetical protein D0867_04239 [Hortaea werneckii]RMY33144.1 hypothetical protein D0866_06128 [Hortaea werneckii]